MGGQASRSAPPISGQTGPNVQVMARTNHNRPRPHFLTLSEAARQAGIGVKRLRLARDQGELPVYRLGERWQLVAWPALLEWLENHKYPTPSDEGER